MLYNISNVFVLFFFFLHKYDVERVKNLKSIIPYTKNISFGSKIAEITSMSLEHEIDIKPGEISGNFIISGEYKSHEVSVNREPFLYKLPFEVELTDQIDLDSIEFEITDFSYDVLNDDTIEVDIEFSLSADEIAVEEEVLNPPVEEVRSVFEKVEDPVVEPNLADLVDMEPIVEEVKEETTTENVEERQVVVEEKKEVVEDMKESEETIINQVNPTDDSFATYHIHIVKEGESIETICTMYHSNMNLLNDYNEMKEINAGDKIIIPKEDE